MTQLKSPTKHFEEIKKIDENGVEYWFARELMPFLGYSKWSNFENISIKKAQIACKKSLQSVKNHFADIGNLVIVGSGAKRVKKDYKLSRYACYLIAQNGDSKKKEVANAQTYFAVQTRKQEIKVRKTIAEIGGTMPENLPIESDIKRVKINKKKLLK